MPGGGKPPKHQKVKDEDIVSFLCVQWKYGDGYGKTCEQVFGWSRGTASAAKRKIRFLEANDMFESLTDEQKSKFLTAMRSMNRGMLYVSPIHGEYHSEKVTLFCVLLGVKLGCTNKELDILIDAGRYHDFMRETDSEDSFHGLGAANNIERVIPRGRYTPSELCILKSIMDYHSTDIRIHNYESIAENHCLQIYLEMQMHLTDVDFLKSQLLI